MMRPKLSPLRLNSLHSSSEWFEEPNLLFANDMVHCDPKVGIPLYGPRSLGSARHKQEVHIGFLGTSEAVEHGKKFYEECACGVGGDNEHAPFPGCK